MLLSHTHERGASITAAAANRQRGRRSAGADGRHGHDERAGGRKISRPGTGIDGRDVTFRWLFLRFECRVVFVIDEAERRGFAYGTLARHPWCGEELFLVEIDRHTNAVTATITAFAG